jgi:16S rRNA (guanine966-N2)-methyltransferase
MPRKPRSKRPVDRTVPVGAVRIIGGTHRGRRLEFIADPRTRPMKDRVREAVFNVLGDVSGMVAIDLFAGTGALGFEALSRGAHRAIFFEQHFPTADAIGKNAASLGLADRCQVISADTLVWFRREIRLPNMPGDGPWLVLCSPPYELFVRRADEMRRLLLALWEASPPQSAFLVEADERFDFATLPEPDRWLLRSYPPAHLGLLWK